MATVRQKLAVKELVENGGNVSRAMLKANYSKKTSKTPQKLTNSKGFIEALDEFGLTDELLTVSLVKDIKKKAGKRARELELGFKVRGRLKENKDGGNTYNFNIIQPDQLKRIAARIIDGDTAEPPASG